MKACTLQSVALAMRGALHQGESDFLLSQGISTDTRNIPSGSLFFALRGEQFDAHEFLAEAAEGGAAALVVEDLKNVPAGVPAIHVDDTLLALQSLAKWYLAELDIPVVAITGSNGKTSTKDFSRSVLSEKFEVHATVGNFNNHIGLPLTILAAPEKSEVIVLEMGMNHSGELAVLCEIAPPKISIITSIGTAHIEHLGSAKAIAQEKATLARVLDKEGTLILPSKISFFNEVIASTTATVLTTGKKSVRAEAIEINHLQSNFELVIEGLGRMPATIPVSGHHMIQNALLAAALGKTMGLTIEQIVEGLATTKLTSGRLRHYDSAGILVIDDTYNANLESVLAAIETLAALNISGRRFVVLGIMAELGDHTAGVYQKVGGRARELGVSLVAVGPETEGYGSEEHFQTAEEAADQLSKIITSGDVVLFKGSRLAAMEKVMQLAFPE